MKEYAIWGVPPNGTHETLLARQCDGKAITIKRDADQIAKDLTERLGCQSVRIQCIEFTAEAVAGLNNQFAKAVKV